MDSDEPLSDALDLAAFTPRLLAILSNIISARESQALRQQFGLGTTDWRILSALAQEPALTATEISRCTVMSKAVISRALADLVAEGLVVLGEGPRGSRPVRLTAKGAGVYRGMLPVAFRAQRLIADTLGEKKLRQLDALLVQLIEVVADDHAWLDGARI